MSVTGDDLRALTGSKKTDTELALFLSMGQRATDTFLGDSGLHPDILSDIALNLCGHYYVLSVEGGGITYSRTGQSEAKYKSFGYDTIGFATTRFGQMACGLDTTGKLMEMSAKNKVGFMFASHSAVRSKPTVDSE
jgi:hypothetical protein